MKTFIGSNKNYKIDSIEKAYTLGFLWGDGDLTSFKNKDNIISNVHYPRLEIVKDDLEKIISNFSIWGEWKIYFRSRPNRKIRGQMILCDKDFGWWLANHDYLEKSWCEPTKILSKIPKKLQPYWWRGWIDADGCFYIYQKQYLRQFSLAGTYEQKWTEAENLFIQLGIENYEKQYRDKKSKSSTIRISNRKDIIKLGNYIYSDNLSIGLKRKYDIFSQIKL